MEEILLPHNKDYEKAVLGTILRYNEYYTEYADIITPSMFYESTYADLYQCAEVIISGGALADINNLATYAAEHNMHHIDKRTIAEVIMAADERCMAQNVEYCLLLARKRGLWATLTASASRLLNVTADIDEEMETLTASINALTQTKEGDGMATLADAYNEVVQIVNENQQGKKQYLPSNFHLLDSHYVLRADTLTILAAFTSVGKSTLAMNICVNVAKNNIPCAYYSLEMGKSELAARTLSGVTNIAAGRILNAKISVSELDTLRGRMIEMSDYPIYFDDNATTSFPKMIRSVRKMVAKHGIKLVVIDYLQIFSQNGESTEAALGAMVREAKNIAKELHIAVLLLSQLNRSSNKPSISMLRGSGQIEESADNVLLIHRPDAYPDGEKLINYNGLQYPAEGKAKLILAKGRGIGTGDSLLNFDKQGVKFTDYLTDEEIRQREELPFPQEQQAQNRVEWDEM